jgi:hypothetical protein
LGRSDKTYTNFGLASFPIFSLGPQRELLPRL